MKTTFIAAHKMTREMVKKYGVDYQTQFGLCISYLLENKEEEEMTNLKGTEKQVKYANDIIEDIKQFLVNAEVAVKEDASEKMQQRFEKRIAGVYEYLESYEEAAAVINDLKDVLSAKLNHEKANKFAQALNEKGLQKEALITSMIPQSFFSF